MAANFSSNPTYIAAAVAFVNGKLIADEALPRVPVYSSKFAYNVYDFDQGLTLPNARIGRKGKTNDVEFSSKEEFDQVESYGYQSPVPEEDVKEWTGAVTAGNTQLPDPRILASSELTDMVHLAREVRVSNLLLDPNSYEAGNRIPLSGSSQWDHVDADIEGQVFDMLDKPIMRPTTMAMNSNIWSKIRRHAKLKAAILGSTGKGTISKEEFCQHFELDKLLVGEGWLNSAPEGQPAQRVRVWGNSVACYYQKPLSATATTKSVTFGVTAQFGGWVAGDIHDPNMGLEGGTIVRVGERVKEKILAKSLGALFQNVLSGG